MAHTLELTPTPASIGEARRWAAAFAVGAGLGGVSETLSLLVSEVVSNVVLHARTPCTVAVEQDGSRLRVEVSDGSDRMPGMRPRTDPLAQSGRGMLLVEGLSEIHGVDVLPGGGKTVWFELALPT